jgi:hypothetical protein
LRGETTISIEQSLFVGALTATRDRLDYSFYLSIEEAITVAIHCLAFSAECHVSIIVFPALRGRYVCTMQLDSSPQLVDCSLQLRQAQRNYPQQGAHREVRRPQSLIPIIGLSAQHSQRFVAAVQGITPLLQLEIGA